MLPSQIYHAHVRVCAGLLGLDDGVVATEDYLDIEHELAEESRYFDPVWSGSAVSYCPQNRVYRKQKLIA